MSERNSSETGLVLSIDLGALSRNWQHLAGLAKPAECAAVVKADAYGIGIEAAGPALWAAGCRTFFVALPQEGARLRAVVPDAVIYVLNGFIFDWAETFRAASLRPVLGTFTAIEAWARHFEGAPSAIQVDTGMNRLGLAPQEALELAGRSSLLESASPRLLMSHLACADEPEHPLNRTQLARFKEVRAAFRNLDASLANSAGIHLGPEYCFDLVRPGIALYGAEFAQSRPPLSTVVTAKARILQIREAAAGETIGYGASKHLEQETRVAILAAGYADGYMRLAGSNDSSAGAYVSVRGRRAALLGRVSMDLMAADVTGLVGVAEGGWAELFGPDIPIDDVARAADTVGYEFLTALSRRAERVYVNATGPG